MYNGKLCASTTRYNDQTKAACGCGTSDPIPSDWWTLTTFTAALNCKNLDSSDPLLAWCPMGCGGCYKLCTTGGTTVGYPTLPDKCRVFKITNRCGDGFGKVGGDWCSNRLSWKECLEDPEKCMEEGSTNWFGYSAHFDLQDFHHQIKDLQWDNVEVTFERVPCNKSWDGPSWDCSCQPSNETLPRPLVPENISLPMRANTKPSMRAGADTHNRRSEMWSIFDSALAVLDRHADGDAAINTTIKTAEPGSVLNDKTPTGSVLMLNTTEEGVLLKPEGVPAEEGADEEAENEQEMQKEKGKEKDKEKENNFEEVKEKEKEDKLDDDEDDDDEEGKARDNCAGAFQQCGGSAWSGTTCCQQGCSCSGGGNAFYRQCIPPAGLNSCSEAERKGAGSDSLVVSFVSHGGTDVTASAAAAQAVDPRFVPDEASWISDASSHRIPDNQHVPSDSPGAIWTRISTLANWQVLALLCALLGGIAAGISSLGLQRGNRGGRIRLGTEHSDSHETTTPCSDCLKSFLSPLGSGWWPLRNASGAAHRLAETP